MKNTLATLLLGLGISFSTNAQDSEYKVGEEMPRYLDVKEIYSRNITNGNQTLTFDILASHTGQFYYALLSKCRRFDEKFRETYSDKIFLYDLKEGIILIDNKNQSGYPQPDGRVDRIIYANNPEDFKEPIEPVICGIGI